MNPVWRLAAKQIRSQWRRSDWLTLMLSLFMMITLVTLLTTTSDRLYQSLTAQSADILGADLVLRSHSPIAADKLLQLQTLQLKASIVTQFISMAESEEASVLSTIRAINNPYPVRGKITTEPSSHPAIPASGSVWVDNSLLSRLELKLGDTLLLGYSEFLISHILLDSPDRGSGFSNFNPQVIMREDQLQATGIIAPGSRANYRLLVRGNKQQISQLQAQWKGQLSKGQRLINASDDSQLDGSSVANASRYLKLSALLSLLLGAVAILLSLQRYSSDQRTRSALLLSLGMTPRQLLYIYSLQLFVGWLAAALLGTLIGLGLHQLIANQIGDYLPNIASLSPLSVFTSPLLALAILFILGLPTLLPLGKVSILQMLRNEKQLSTKRWHYVSCAALLLVAISLYMGSILLASGITLLLLVLGSLAGFSAQRMLVFAVTKLQGRIALAPLLKLRLRQQRHWHKLQAGVFSLLLAIMAVLFFVRGDLIEQWQSQLPKDSPNHFAINIQPWEKDRLQQWMLDQQIKAKLYPIVRGRINQVNNKPVKQVLSTEQNHTRALHRELNLTWQTQLTDANSIIAGSWDPLIAGVSIEQGLSESLGLKVGDTLGLSIAGEQLVTPITSIRKVNWGSFKPNFFLIYTPNLLEQFPSTYITSFNINEQQRDKSTLLVKTFPTITLIDIDKLFKQAQDIINKLADSASVVMLLTLFSGILMLFTILQQELAQRRYEGALLQTLGASERQTRQLDLLEFLLLGATCGSIAAIIAELLLALMSARLFNLPVIAHPLLWISLPIIATVTFTLIGNLVRSKLSLSQCYGLLKAG
ncbi:MAG: FtsX-like permease family protein [Oceanospirillaceae bacterium]|nr:FtsX-like permease family protein [Oceanospirillaceae bacterium]